MSFWKATLFQNHPWSKLRIKLAWESQGDNFKAMLKLKITLAKTYWQKAKGLLGTTTPQNLLLKTHWGIHTFGMKYPIDVVVLDAKNNIVKLKPHLLPNHIFLWNPKYETVLELPPGFIEKNELALGNRIKLIME